MSSYDNYSDPAPRVRPRALTVVCVLAIVFGALGLLAGCVGLLSQLAASAVQQALTAGQAGSGGPTTELQSAIMAITAKHSTILVPLTILKILVEAALLTGGIMALGYKSTGRSLLSKALLAALILECIQFIPTVMVQREAQAVTAELMPKIMAAQGGNAVPAGFDMSAMMRGIGAVTLAFGLVWLVAKVILYILGMRYLATPAIAALFSPSENSGMN